MSEFEIVCVFFLKENADQESCCWRNLFSCINLVRILQKLTKWKHSRTMVTMPFFLVLFVVLEASVFFSSIRLSNEMEFWFLVITGSFLAGYFPPPGDLILKGRGSRRTFKRLKNVF